MSEEITKLPHPKSPDHEWNGKFSAGNQAGVGKGRPKKDQEIAALEAVRRAAPPERIEFAIDQMFLLAERHSSWKAYDRAVTLALEYQVGKPVARIETSTEDPISASVARYRAEKEAIDAEFTARHIETAAR
ncbi:MAG TPA: hypothetical protein VNJ01_12330 [Bacteriovoracaceae bacterium]|nr:hypothetical protein [Bacteriovoracaceae bacterium]